MPLNKLYKNRWSINIQSYSNIINSNIINIINSNINNISIR